MELRGLQYGYLSYRVKDRKPFFCTDRSALLCKCIDGDRHPRKILTDRGSDTFFEFPKYRLQIPRRIIPPKGYPLEPRFLGEHIRKRRLDLGLLQIDVAAQIGVTKSTV
jgi:hypothetical protein